MSNILAWIGLLASGLLCMLAFPSIYLSKVTSASTASLSGSILITGLILSSYIHEFRRLYLTHGCMLGVGSSMIFPKVLLMIAKWFVK